MRRLLIPIGFCAAATFFAAGALALTPPPSGARAVIVEPSPVVSATTLPQLPTVAPVMPTYAPTATPTTAPTAAPSVIAAPPGTVIQVVGDVVSPRVFTLKDLQRMRRTSLTLRMLDPDGKRRVHFFTGVLLADLISAAAPSEPGGAATSTTEYALVQGVSGKSALISFPEFEPQFNGKQILVAYLMDGGDLPGNYIGELIVPEDNSQGRFIMGISTIRVSGP